MDYESPLARDVAGKVWSGLSHAALDEGYSKLSAAWTGIGEGGAGDSGDEILRVYTLGQDRPDAVDSLGVAGSGEAARLYGLVVAVPEKPSPLSGPLLYQGVERLTETGIRAGAVEPALLRAAPEECERYARRLLERLRAARRTA